MLYRSLNLLFASLGLVLLAASVILGQTPYFDACPSRTFKVRFLNLVLGKTYKRTCSVDKWTVDDDDNADDELASVAYQVNLGDKDFYLCGGKMSQMPTWFKNRQSSSRPIVHVVNGSLFFSPSKTSQENSDASKLDSNATSAGSTVQDDNKSNPRVNWCMLVNFFAPYCPFSAKLAKNYNALAKSFPDLFVAAVDATQNAKLNLIFGISGTPTIVLFQNGRPVVRYDQSDYHHESLVNFITRQTDLIAKEEVVVVDEDEFGPLADFIKEKQTNYYLLISWYFIAACALYYSFTSSIADRLLEVVRRNWREMNEE